jgi:hypothetical protein
MSKIAAPDAANGFHAEHARLLLDSYRRILGRPLMDIAEDAVDFGAQVFHANFALASHNTDADPLFNYANRVALDLFEFAWDELIGLPSRLSAEAAKREAREKLLAEVQAEGFIEGYSGIRIAKSGKRFKIKNTVVWNVYDRDGGYRGQAACFKDWEVLP